MDSCDSDIHDVSRLVDIRPYQFEPLGNEINPGEDSNSSSETSDNDDFSQAKERLMNTNWRYRFMAFRRFVQWIWHRLGRHNRKILPACVVKKIRDTFPSETYSGFKYAVV
ncbi:Hypothetical predicted protein [Mytilus galloprovincialis]|uniref:P2X purinoreceptor 7 intracellular domain-containing protein n=1 Tax=Mytilus galloprovincialis TaxID=29158 RepID=A0A8B6BJ26_MYTGA|nr:Hypothetical predicted protein [Mytilus galloprovincialis]